MTGGHNSLVAGLTYWVILVPYPHFGVSAQIIVQEFRNESVFSVIFDQYHLCTVPSANLFSHVESFLESCHKSIAILAGRNHINVIARTSSLFEGDFFTSVVQVYHSYKCELRKTYQTPIVAKGFQGQSTRQLLYTSLLTPGCVVTESETASYLEITNVSTKKRFLRGLVTHKSLSIKIRSKRKISGKYQNNYRDILHEISFVKAVLDILCTLYTVQTLHANRFCL